MVGTAAAEVERLLAGGVFTCPCGGVLGGWGYARERVVRGLPGRLRPRRARCRGCGRTHVLLPVSVLVRRADCVAVIGAALLAFAGGWGHRRVAAAVGVPVSTVRGWLRRFAVRARGWRERFTVVLVGLDPAPGPVRSRGWEVADAVEVIGLGAASAVRRFGPRPPWEFASAISGGLLLGPVGSGPVPG